MDFTASNQDLWKYIIQLGFISFIMIFANLLRRKIKFFRVFLLPTAVIGGFLGLALRNWGLISLDIQFLEGITYHMTGIGFIALALRSPAKSERGESASSGKDGINSGAFIVSNYLIQGITGIGIMMILGYSFFPDIFKAGGIILPMGYGQGPGQAYSVGNMYEQTFGFAGGASFGLAIATMGMLWASIGGIIYLNVLAGKKRKNLDHADQIRLDRIQEPVVSHMNEIPLTEAVDKFTIQMSFVFLVYLATYLLAFGLTRLINNISALEGFGKSIIPLIWGFNFLIGSSLALLLRGILAWLYKGKILKRKYTNNFLLNRISGYAFDLMILASISAISIKVLQKLWLPFILITSFGGLVTLFYIKWMAKRIYPDYYLEGLLSMYGMMTGTVSTGILLLREVDPAFSTPASNNLVVGSSLAIVLGFPMMLMVGMAPQSNLMLWIVFFVCILYFIALNAFILWNRPKKKTENKK